MSFGPEVNGIVVEFAGDSATTAADVQRLMQTSSDVVAFALVRPYRELIDPRTNSWQLGAGQASRGEPISSGSHGPGHRGV